MDSRIVGERLELQRSENEKRPLVQRLSRIEGQIRGLRVMIEEDRYCLDEVQQIKAATAALNEVAVLIVSQHVEAGVRTATRGEDQEAALSDLLRVLRSALRG